MEAATEMSTPCCCFRNKGALQSGSGPAGTAGFGVGGGTQHRLFHKGNQGPLLEKAKQIFPNKNRSRETCSFHHGVFYICCDLFLLSSAHDPPIPAASTISSSLPCPTSTVAPLHWLTAAPPHRLTGGGLRSPPVTSMRRQAERQRRGMGHQSFVPSSQEKGCSFPWAAVCFRSLCSQEGHL